MATPVDLSGVLAEVEDRCRAWLAGALKDVDRAPPVEPCVAKVWYRLPGSSTFEPLTELPIAAGKLDPHNLRERIEMEIVSVVGSSPSGYIRIRVWESKKASKPAVAVERKLMPVEGFDGDPSLALTKHLLFRILERAEKSEALMQQHAAGLAASQAVLADAVAKLGTQRAVSSSAADLGSPWAWIGIAAMIIGYPVVKRQLGLNPDATIDQVAIKLAKTFDEISKEVGRTPTVPGAHPAMAPPPGAAALIEDKGANGGNGGGLLDLPPELAHLAPALEVLRHPTPETIAELGRLEAKGKAMGYDLVDALTKTGKGAEEPKDPAAG